VLAADNNNLFPNSARVENMSRRELILNILNKRKQTQDRKYALEELVRREHRWHDARDKPEAMREDLAPLFMALLRQKRVRISVRRVGVLRLAEIKKKWVIPYLIEAVGDPERGVSADAAHNVSVITRHEFEYERGWDASRRLRISKKLMKWWKGHKDEVEPDWSRAGTAPGML
jgi:hypothetical protein